MQIITANLAYISVGLLIAVAVLLVFCTITIVGLAKLKKRYSSMMEGFEGEKIEMMLANYRQKTDKAIGEIHFLQREILRMKDGANTYLQHISMLRYGTFYEKNSDISFSLALLDDNGDGVVISSIATREENRFYGKPVKEGKETNYRLTKEEQEAIALAMQEAGKLKRPLSKVEEEALNQRILPINEAQLVKDVAEDLNNELTNKVL